MTPSTSPTARPGPATSATRASPCCVRRPAGRQQSAAPRSMLRRPSSPERHSPPTPRTRPRSSSTPGSTTSASVTGTFFVHDDVPHSSRSLLRSVGVDVDAAATHARRDDDAQQRFVPLKVAYDFLLTNASSTIVPMSDPSVNSAGCSPLVRGSGDTNANNLLDNGRARITAAPSSTPSLGRRTRTPSRRRRARSTAPGQRRRPAHLHDPQRAHTAASDADQDRRSRHRLHALHGDLHVRHGQRQRRERSAGDEHLDHRPGLRPAVPASADLPQARAGGSRARSR